MHLILKLSWGEKMKLYDLSIVLIVLAAVAALGIGSQFVLGDDNHVEEMAEEYVEDHIEEKFNLEDGTINLDFSPNSEESSD
jgi:hypothetical protein